MNHCFLMMDDDPMEQEPLDFLSREAEEEEDVIFYSEKMIESEDYGEDYEAYFDVWSLLIHVIVFIIPVNH